MTHDTMPLMRRLRLLVVKMAQDNYTERDNAAASAVSSIDVHAGC